MQEKIIPKHIAVICDGNRRWARAQGLNPSLGHKKAVEETFEPLIDYAASIGVEHMTFWIFSTENWKREKKEVDFLMNLFRGFFDHQVKRFHQKNIRVKVIGNRSMMPKDIQQRIKEGEELTKDNSLISVTLAMSYGGRDEIVRAVEKNISAVIPDLLARQIGGIRNLKGNESDQQILKIVQDDNHLFSKELFEKYLDTYGTPDPELIIRTSGESRTSGFLLWQSEYSEWYFPEWHFPDFSPEKLDECIAEFNSRKRRFGK